MGKPKTTKLSFFSISQIPTLLKNKLYLLYQKLMFDLNHLEKLLLMLEINVNLHF